MRDLTKMFVNRELVTSKNKFTKPNILRKKPKGTLSKKTQNYSESESARDVIAPPDHETINNDLQRDVMSDILETPNVESAQCVDAEIFQCDSATDYNLLDNIGTVNSEDELCNLIQISEEASQSENPSSDEILCTVTPIQNVSIEYITSSTMSFKCDIAGCNRKFRNPEKFKNHKDEHNPDGSMKLAKQTASECPVKKTDASGVEVKCARTFLIKEDLMKHLKEDHKPEEAAFVCWECGRRFFWATGLRAHGRAHCGRAALLCAWPGCGRAFRHPCRLREHARAHTGDKPYPCRYPNCGWSFRTASKLLRHARRHTNERAHACGACGRAFLRREHLREHAARHRQHRAPCSHPGCQRTFTNEASLQAHQKKAHREELSARTDSPPVASKKSHEKFVVSIEAPTLKAESAGAETVAFTDSADAVDFTDVADIGVDADVDVGWRAARTHCTWPLDQRPEAVFYPEADAEYVLREVHDSDPQVELSEGTESNIYTIRSDLFLHGNVLNNEDSEQMAVAGGAGLEADLGLLDTHPTIDLMQEEMLYTDDVAVDESSFRVFLLSGEEIQIV